MSAGQTGGDRARGGLSLIARKWVAASPEAVFAAWTEPAQLERWWGPVGVKCTAAQVDLRVGGRYRLANELGPGEVLWITGTFDVVERPWKLVYTWAHEPVDAETEQTRVTVRFEARGAKTEVIVIHERLPSLASRDTHLAGWGGCLAGLDGLFAAR